MLVEENSNHYVQVRGQGGAPDTKIKVRLKITYTDGSVETTDWGEIEPAYGLNWTGAKFVYDTNKNIKDMKLYDENGNEIDLNP